MLLYKFRGMGQRDRFTDLLFVLFSIDLRLHSIDFMSLSIDSMIPSLKLILLPPKRNPLNMFAALE